MGRLTTVLLAIMTSGMVLAEKSAQRAGILQVSLSDEPMKGVTM